MAEKKQHTIVNAAGEKTTAPKATAKASAPKAAGASPVTAETKSQAKSKRLIAWIFWVLAFACEVLACLIFAGKLDVPFINKNQMLAFIIALVLDLALVIVGAQFWKKANHMDPVSEAKAAKFWLHNNMGVIVCCFAFIPFIIVALTQKDADPKMKRIAVIAAAAALLIGGAASYDWNPVSEEGITAAAETLGDTTVYWTEYGKKYHTHEDCQHLDQTDVLYSGTVDEAVNAGRSSICKTCAKNDNLEIGDNGAVYGEISTEAVEEIVEEVVEETTDAAA